MEFIKVKTRVFLPPQDDIFVLMDDYLPKLVNGDVILLTSKILAVHQGRCIKDDGAVNKDDLIISEAERYIPRCQVPGEYALLTVKEHTLIPSAGIDSSNANGYFILWPENPDLWAKRICLYLKDKFDVQDLAVIIVDSHSIPMRSGVMGISTGFYGLKPLRDYRGQKDIFNREIKISRANIVDPLASMGVLLMGEGNEKTPLVIVRGAEFIEFTSQDTYRDLLVPWREDIYYPLLRVFTDKDKE